MYPFVYRRCQGASCGGKSAPSVIAPSRTVCVVLVTSVCRLRWSPKRLPLAMCVALVVAGAGCTGHSYIPRAILSPICAVSSQQSAASRQQRRFKTVCARAMARVRWRWGTYFGGRVAGPRGCSVRVDHISVAQAVVAGSPATLHASVSASHAAPRLPPWSSTRRRQAPAGVAWGRC